MITDLDVGGAEGMLTRVAGAMQSDQWRAHVVSIMSPGVMAEPLERAGIPVESLGIRQGVPDPRAVTRLRRVIREVRPDLVQTWMYHADLIGGIAAALERRPVVWNIRHSNLSREVTSLSTRFSARASAALSPHIPGAVIYCSHAAIAEHRAVGYNPAREQVLPNGFDLERFAPDPRSRSDVRAALGAADGDFVIGIVGRYHPMKDHRTFVEAAARFCQQHQAIFVLVGNRCDPSNKDLMRMIDDSGARSRFRLLGRRDDVHRLVRGFDIATLSSRGEGFPNAVGEAMASAIPCVVTDVGDSAFLVADTGIVVPPADPAALADGWRRMADLSAESRAELGRRARERMEEHFSIEVVAAAYASLYEEVLVEAGTGGSGTRGR